MSAKKKRSVSDPGYACGTAAGVGACATCPPGCRGRKAFEAALPKWELVIPESEETDR